MAHSSKGGARFIPSMEEYEAREFIEEMTAELSEQDRLLPGGYVYLSDLLGTVIPTKFDSNSSIIDFIPLTVPPPFMKSSTTNTLE